MQDSYASKLKLLMWISGLVLLIACANIANLLLVRGMNRRAEMSVRTALGAMRTRIVRQLLTESIVLSIISGMAGLIVAYAGTRMLLAMAFPGAQNVPIDASPSGVVLAFAFGISLLTGILFGVAPAWITSNANPADALRSGTRTTTSGASLLQRSLIVLQSALALVLLVGAGMFIQSLNKLRNIDLKLDSDEPIHRPFQPAGSGLLPRPGGSPLSHHRRPVPRHPRRPKGWHLHQHPNGGQQHGRWRPNPGPALPQRRGVLGQGQRRILRLRRNPRPHGTRLHHPGHLNLTSRRRRQSVLRQKILQARREPDRSPLRLTRAAILRRL